MKLNSKRNILFVLIALIAISIPAAYAVVQTSIDDFCDPAPTSTIKAKYWICHDLHPRVTALESITVVNGTDGQDGVDGATGPQGIAGINGINGTNGVDGAIGLQGIQGISGINGVNGTNGIDGTVGPQGPQGIQGLPGQGIIGEIKLYSGTTAPTGFLIADGAAVPRDDFSLLFAVIGTTYGAGDGSTTFNLPDLSQKFARGGTPGNTGGSDTVALTISEMPSHNHGITDPNHGHDTRRGSSSAYNPNFVPQVDHRGGTYVYPPEVVDSNRFINSASTGITINNAGSGNAHENLPPYLEILYIIKW